MKSVQREQIEHGLGAAIGEHSAKASGLRVQPEAADERRHVDDATCALANQELERRDNEPKLFVFICGSTAATGERTASNEATRLQRERITRTNIDDAEEIRVVGFIELQAI